MKRSQVFAGAALLVACAGSVSAQWLDNIPVEPREEVREVHPVGFPPSGYAGRAIGTVYNNGGDAGTNTNGITLGTSCWGDEMDFSVGPWATAPVRLATTLRVWIQATCTTAPANYDLLIDFWADADHDYEVADMIALGATPLASLRVQNLTGTCGIQSGWDINLTGLPGGGVNIPSNKVFIQYRIVDVGTTTLRAPTGVLLPVFGIGTTLVGQSTPSYGRDMNANSTFLGGTPVIVGAAAGAHEHRRTSATLNTNQRGRLLGDIPPPPEPTSEDLGVLTDAGLSITRAIGAGEVKWFKFTINGAANDVSHTFLDIAAEGSTNPNLSMALYNSGATLSASDFDDGTLNDPQLTFGVARRGAPGDGRQYDGRDGQLTPGTYLLAVSSGNASFSDAYSVSTTATDAGDAVISFATNVNGTPAAAAVVPAGPTVTAVGQLLVPGAATAAVTPGRQDTVWYTFEVCAPISGDNYLDIDLSQSTASANTEAFLFNSSGNLVVADNDDGPALLSQLSFGNTSSPRPAIGDGQAFAGQDGNLDIGTYYLGVGLSDTAELVGAATNGRFHLRSNSGSTLGVTTNFLTNVAQCGVPCGTADFDGDGDTGTDADIEAFFACLAGNCCATCYPGGSDFNADGDAGTDADIESFFRVLSGGPC